MEQIVRRALLFLPLDSRTVAIAVCLRAAVIEVRTVRISIARPELQVPKSIQARVASFKRVTGEMDGLVSRNLGDRGYKYVRTKARNHYIHSILDQVEWM
jgi:hypothetical protein